MLLDKDVNHTIYGYIYTSYGRHMVLGYSIYHCICLTLFSCQYDTALTMAITG